MTVIYRDTTPTYSLKLQPVGQMFYCLKKLKNLLKIKELGLLQQLVQKQTSFKSAL